MATFRTTEACWTGYKNIHTHINAMRRQIVEVTVVGDSRTDFAAIEQAMGPPNVKIAIAGAGSGALTAGNIVQETTSLAQGMVISDDATNLYIWAPDDKFVGGLTLTDLTTSKTRTGGTKTGMNGYTLSAPVGYRYGYTKALDMLGVPMCSYALGSGSTSQYSRQTSGTHLKGKGAYPEISYLFAGTQLGTGATNNIYIGSDTPSASLGANFGTFAQGLGFPHTYTCLKDNTTGGLWAAPTAEKGCGIEIYLDGARAFYDSANPTLESATTGDYTSTTADYFGSYNFYRRFYDSVGFAAENSQDILFQFQYGKLRNDASTPYATDGSIPLSVTYGHTGGAITSSPVAGAFSVMNSDTAVTTDILSWKDVTVSSANYNPATDWMIRMNFSVNFTDIQGPVFLGYARASFARTYGFSGVTLGYARNGFSSVDVLNGATAGSDQATGINSIDTTMGDAFVDALCYRQTTLGQAKLVLEVIALGTNYVLAGTGTTVTKAAHKTAMAGIMDARKAMYARRGANVKFILVGPEKFSDTAADATESKYIGYLDAHNELAVERNDCAAFDRRGAGRWSVRRGSGDRHFLNSTTNRNSATYGLHSSIQYSIDHGMDLWGSVLAMEGEYNTSIAGIRGWGIRGGAR